MRQEKKFQELNLSDNFLFSAVMEESEICKEVLELLLKIPIEKVTITSEKTIVTNPEYRGVRMDVYAVDEDHSVYNIEMQTTNKGNIPKRSRYYQAQIDAFHLRPGANFNSLPRSIIIFICTFDPFEQGRCTYTFENQCLESEIVLGDGTRKIFLNTKGDDNETDMEVKQFLKYVEHSTSEFIQHTDSAFIQRLHNQVMMIKQDRKLEEHYMLFGEMLDDEREQGRQEGLREGIKEGRQVEREVISKLIREMCMDNKLKDIDKLFEDEETLNKMLKKYQINQL